MTMIVYVKFMIGSMVTMTMITYMMMMQQRQYGDFSFGDKSVIDVIDIDSDEESYSVKTSYVSSTAVPNTDNTPFKGNPIVSSQMTPSMESLTMNKSVKSPNLTAQSNSSTAIITTIHPSFSPNALTKRKFITTPKRSPCDQPLRQNQYQLI